MSKDESDESLQLGLPIKTTYEWRPSSSPIDLHIWSSSNIFKPNSLKDPELLVVLIPGNPGLVDFYDVFLSKLYENLNSKSISTSIICNGHVGHSLNRLNSEMKYLANFGLFGTQQKALNDVGGYGTLKDQIDYHQDFIGHLGKLIDPKKTKVILIGHSVGAYIATKVRINLNNHLSSLSWTLPKNLMLKKLCCCFLISFSGSRETSGRGLS